jgi:hypothetical protein
VDDDHAFLLDRSGPAVAASLEQIDRFMTNLAGR